nr:copia protein [Tanacetum cinerariifolium]
MASRPDIMFRVCLCARFQEAPKTSHLEAVKRIFRYIEGTMYLGLWYPKGTGIKTVVYADSDHVEDYVDRKSTSGICTFVGCFLTSWFSNKQIALAISTTKVEYISAEKACQQALWMKQALINYEEMLRNCHGHNLSKGNIIKIFYHGLNKITKEVLNAIAGDSMTMKLDAQYKDFQSRLKKSNIDDDDISILADKQSGQPSGSLPSNTQSNPKGSSSKPYQPPQARNEHVNVVFTRSGKSYDPPDNLNDQQNDSETPINVDNDDEDDEPTPQPKPKTLKPVKETPIPKPYKPKIPYPQRLRKEKIEAQYGKFLDMIRAIQINQLNLRVGTKRMIFHIDSAMKHSYSNDDTCFSIDVIDEILEEDFDALLDEGSEILHSIEGTILKEKSFAEFDEFM